MLGMALEAPGLTDSVVPLHAELQGPGMPPSSCPPPASVASSSESMLGSSDGRTPPQDSYYADYDSQGYLRPDVSPPPLPLPGQGDSSACSPGICAGCGETITDRYYLTTVEQCWHVHCLMCVDCHRPLDTQMTCYAKDGNIYCKEDYYRRFAVKQCARCHMSIASHEMVMKARQMVFHLNCFTCCVCMKMLTPGEHFGMQHDMVYCRVHYEDMVCGGGTGGGGGPPDMAGMHDGFQVRAYNGVGGTQKGRPRKRKAVSEMDLIPNPIGRISMDGDFCSDLDLSGIHGNYGATKHKRMRTSFKHNQLRTMRTYFSLNHNPDAKDLKDLSSKTGLSKKVLQVWFQNARAKYRRNMTKQDQAGAIKDEQNNNNDGSSSSEKMDNNCVKNFSRSPGALSDISSSTSLSEMPGLQSRDMQDKSTSGSSCLADLCHGRL